jgi:hypothetical protein
MFQQTIHDYGWAEHADGVKSARKAETDVKRLRAWKTRSPMKVIVPAELKVDLP